MSARVGMPAREEQVKAIARLVSSGWLQLVMGERSHEDAAVSAERVSAELLVSVNDVRVEPGGVVRLGPIEGRVERSGVVRWFRLLTPERLSVLDGDVGVRDGDLNLDRIDLLAGDKVTIAELRLTAAETR